jgi:uncharacterized protein YkwD
MLLHLLLTILLPASVPGEITIEAGPMAPIQEESPSEIDILRGQLIKARTTKSRDAIFDQLVELAEYDESAEEALSLALTTRWTQGWAQISKSSLMRKLEKLAEERDNLDAARAAALELILDEERYFYPYKQPDVSAKRAAEYPPVQREVLRLAKDVSKIWSSTPRVKIPKKFNATLLEFQWLRDQNGWIRGELQPPTEQPQWMQYLRADSGPLTFSNFAMDAEEAIRLPRDAKVLAYNERIWGALKPPKKNRSKDEFSGPVQRFPKDPAREQVRVTNRYRIMMGIPALTWDPILQAATRMHSDYMERTGEFSHYEKDPGRKTPFDRMRLCGYTNGASENCSNGPSSPEAAHESWMSSSGHHRNLLKASHLQMASAGAGPYWTQNFGRGREAEEQL